MAKTAQLGTATANAMAECNRTKDVAKSKSAAPQIQRSLQIGPQQRGDGAAGFLKLAHLGFDIAAPGKGVAASQGFSFSSAMFILETKGIEKSNDI